MKKQIFASLLSLALGFSLVPTNVLAEEELQHDAAFTEEPTEFSDDSNTVEPVELTSSSMGDEVEEAGELKSNEALLAADGMSGNCGATGNETNVTWKLEQNNHDSSNPTYTLIISGNGVMADYSKAEVVPWNKYKDQITQGVVSEGITHLGARTFVLTKLQNVTLPQSLESIGESAFNQSALTTISLPGKLHTIGRNAFWHGNITGELVIPQSVKVIEQGAFDQNKLTKITLPSGLETLGPGALKANPLISMPEIPKAITSLDSTFQGCTSLTEIKIPDHVTHLNRTFMGCTALTEVTIPETVESYIGVFNGCTSLTKATIKSSANNIGGENTNNAWGVFGGCTKLKTVSVPEWVTTIGLAAFKGCSSLETTDFIERAKCIKGDAFSGCTSLKGNLNLTATEIKAYAFDNCTGLGPNISLAHAEITESGVFRNCTNLTGIAYAQKISGGTNLIASKTAGALLNGGEFSTNTDLSGTDLAIPKKEGYTFAGWYNNNSFSGDSVTTPQKNETYYAKWVTEITFNGNGETSGSMGAQQVTEGDTSTKLIENNFNKTGYTFSGWNTEADGKGMSYAADDVASNVPNGTTLYAQWTPNTYTINFDANGGEGTMNSITATYDQPVNLTANGFTKSGKKFAGWATSQDKADAGTVEYTDKGEVKNLTADKNARVTLYAVWVDKDVLSPNVTTQNKTYNGQTQHFDLDGGFTIKYKQNGSDVADPKNVGAYDVVISRAEDDNYAEYQNTVNGGLVINKASLTIKADDKFIRVGDALPNFTYTVTGLFGQDQLITNPTVSCADADANKEGTYTIEASGANAGDNYNITYLNGTLTVSKRYSGGGDSSGASTQKLNKVYRAYNPNNGEHLYTLDEKEYKHVTSIGWHDEGVAFMAETEKNGQALYRVYNPNSGLHHYTTDENEKNTLVSLGWNEEGIAWYASNKPQSAPVYRVYNPNDGQHHYTVDGHEKDVLVSLGWTYEGIAFRTAPIETK